MGLCTSVAAGFAVQVAHLLGAKDDKGARVVLRQALVLSLLFGFLLAATGCGISGYLPRWLGGDEAIRHDATGFTPFHCLPSNSICWPAVCCVAVVMYMYRAY